MYSKVIAKEVSVNGAIIFGQICSSHMSFEGKNMLTIKDDKKYFFLTSDVIQDETALSYKQQAKAIKELEDAGYIETERMGIPAKKYFHITDQIEKAFFGNGITSNAKRGELDNHADNTTSIRSEPAPLSVMPKGKNKELQKGSYIKETKEKELTKKISSSSSSSDTQMDNESFDSIDQKLEREYPLAPFNEIKKDVLSDSGLVIETAKQYEGALTYRLKNYKPAKKKKFMRQTEKIDPVWLKDNKSTSSDTGKKLSSAEIDEQRRQLMIELGTLPDSQDE